MYNRESEYGKVVAILIHVDNIIKYQNVFTLLLLVKYLYKTVIGTVYGKV